jgi:hypothetical protein
MRTSSLFILFLSIFFGHQILNAQNFTPLNTGFACPAEAVDLQIYNGLAGTGGQGGMLVPDAEEETKGAVTVANLNDTDGDGLLNPDDEIRTITPDRDDDDVYAGTTGKGRDEIDLMKLMVNQPQNSNPTDLAILSIESGVDQIKFWGESRKKTSIPVVDGKIIFQCSQLPAEIYIEAIKTSAAIRDIKLKLTYGTQSDVVTATAIWATLVETYMTRDNCGCPLPTNSNDCTCTNNPLVGNSPNVSYVDIPGIDNGLINGINNLRVSFDKSRFGKGNLRSDDSWYGGRVIFGFKIEPGSVEQMKNEFKLKFDRTRRIIQRNYVANWGNDGIILKAGMTSSEMNEFSNDDDGDGDEDNDLTGSFPLVYSWDGPSDSRSLNYPFLVEKRDFEEWVRVTIDNSINIPPTPTSPSPSTNGLFGSRCSQKQDWRLIYYLKKNVNSLSEKLIVDNENFSTTEKKFTGVGNGILQIAETGTLGVQKAYTLKFLNQEWKLSSGYDGVTPIASAVFDNIAMAWVLTDPGIAVFTIKKGSIAFANGAKFTFNAFRRANNQPKPNIFDLKHLKIIENEY